MRKAIVTAVLLTLFAALPRALAATDLSTDAAALAQLETRALHADPREQAFLYTELVQVYTDVAGKQMAAGEMEQAGITLRRVQTFADRIHTGLAKDTRRLKNAEMMMHDATHRLGQYVHFVSTEDKVVVEATIKQLDKVNEELLAQVFAH